MRRYGQYIRAEDRQWPSAQETTKRAQQVWEACYGTPWPDGWIVRWKNFRRRYGDCNRWQRVIRLNWLHFRHQLRYGRVFDKPILETLVHEFTHLRHPDLKHGTEFQRMIILAYERLVGPDSKRLGELITKVATRKARQSVAAEKAWSSRRAAADAKGGSLSKRLPPLG